MSMQPNNREAQYVYENALIEDAPISDSPEPSLPENDHLVYSSTNADANNGRAADKRSSPRSSSTSAVTTTVTHAEEALLDTVFGLLFNVSIVFLLASFIIFGCVFSLPSRSDKVSLYNAGVKRWNEGGRREFDAALFNLTHIDSGANIASTVMLASSMLEKTPANDDSLNDSGSDLNGYDSLLFSLTATANRAPVQTGSNVVETLTLTVVPNSDSNDSEPHHSFNVTIPSVIRPTSATGTISQHTCSEYKGRFDPNGGTCEYFAILTAACLRVAKFNHSWHLYDGSGPWNPPPVDVNATSALTLADYDTGIGCSQIDSNSKWMIGKYQPLTDDPYTRARAMKVTSYKQPKTQHEQEASVRSAEHTSVMSVGEAGNDNSNHSSSSSSSSSSSTGASSSSSSYPNFVTSSSSSSSSSSPTPPLPSQAFRLEIRHHGDPFLLALALTDSTLWFGLARHSLLLLSLWLFIFGCLFMLGRVGTRYGFWCGLLWLTQSLKAHRASTEDDSAVSRQQHSDVSLSTVWQRARSNVTKKMERRRLRKDNKRSLYSHINQQHPRPDEELHEHDPFEIGSDYHSDEDEENIIEEIIEMDDIDGDGVDGAEANSAAATSAAHTRSEFEQRGR